MLQKLVSGSSVVSFSCFQAKMPLPCFCLKCNFFWCGIFLMQLIVKHLCLNKNILRIYLGSNPKKIRILRISKNYGILIKKCVLHFYLYSADLSKCFSQLIVSKFILSQLEFFRLEKLFSIHCFNICLYSINFSLDFVRWKRVGLPHIAYIVIH